MSEWNIEIKPRKGLFEINLKELWQYRDLFWIYVKRDIVTVYKQTILGPAWFVIQPLITTFIFMVVFGGIAGISTDGLPQPLFYMAGIVCWNYFSTSLIGTAGTFSSNQGVFSKVYFPRLVVPFSLITSNLLKLSIQLLLFIGFYIYFVVKGVEIRPGIYLIFLPLIILLLALLALSVGIIISSLTTKYRDLSFLTGFAIQLWMYVTPVIYPLNFVPENFRKFAVINPVTHLVEAFRYATMGVGNFDWYYLAYSASVTIVLLFIGTILFTRTQQYFMDTI